MVYQFRQYHGGVILSLDSIIKTSLTSNNQHILSGNVNNSNNIYKLIDIEFKKDFIEKLYPNPIWTERVYWNVIGRIQNEHEDYSLVDIQTKVDRYLEDNKLCVSQIDLIKFIRDSIISHQIEGKAKITDVYEHAVENGIVSERFYKAIKQLKLQGDIFEPREGFYKCI